MESASRQSNTDTIFDIIQEIRASMSHHESLLNLAEQLRRKNLNSLLQNARYREFLICDPERMLAQLDELQTQRELSEKAYFVCNQCVNWLFHTPGEPVQRRVLCVMCRTDKGLSCRTAYLPKE